MTRRIKRIIKIALGVITLMVLALAFIMAGTNPSKDEHKKVLAQIVNKYDMNKLKLTDAEREQYMNYVCNGSGVNILRKEVMPRFMVEDNTLWSTGYIIVEQQDGTFAYKKKVTTGLFNKVSAVDEQELMQYILEAHRINEQRTATAAGASQQ